MGCYVNTSLSFYSLTETVLDRLMKKSDIKLFTSWLGKRSYKSRLKRFGLERLQEIARENGKKGGRPRVTGEKEGDPK